MFGLFKKKTPIEKLEIQYRKLKEEAFRLSHSDRRLSDEKNVEAEAVMEQIEKLRKSENL